MADDNPTIKFDPSNVVKEDGPVALEAEGLTEPENWTYRWKVVDADGGDVGTLVAADQRTTEWRAEDVRPGVYHVTVEAQRESRTRRSLPERMIVQPRALGKHDRVGVDIERRQSPDTEDIALWEVIRLSTEAISFSNYTAFMDYLFCGTELPEVLRGNAGARDRIAELGDGAAPLPFPDIDAYKVLKAATEAFLLVNCDVALEKPAFPDVRRLSASERERLGLDPGASLETLWNGYLESVNGDRTIPYLALVRQKLGDIDLSDRREGELCDEILRQKFTNPCLLELIWSYWHEEGMLVHTMDAVSARFQNRRGPAQVDPLANLEVAPLRPLSNLLWGYIQDEQHRLPVARRAYEYDHEYGLALFGRTRSRVRGADSRSKFLEAFHNLLHRAAIFYKEDDDTTMIADAFPVLNALREVHLLLAEGAHNQYGDLPWTARMEMLMEQWLLARPEFREFLPTRTMVVYPEPWMERVDAMKRIQGWTDTSVRFFHDLAVFGEQILLSVRFGNWSAVFDRHQAANWARAWRQEVQWYVHAYQAVTGVDLSADMADVRQAEQAEARAQQPALHLQRRLAEQRRRAGIQPPAQAPGAVRGGGRRARAWAVSGEQELS